MVYLVLNIQYISKIIRSFWYFSVCGSSFKCHLSKIRRNIYKFLNVKYSIIWFPYVLEERKKQRKKLKLYFYLGVFMHVQPCGSQKNFFWGGGRKRGVRQKGGGFVHKWGGWVARLYWGFSGDSSWCIIGKISWYVYLSFGNKQVIQNNCLKVTSTIKLFFAIK